MKFKFKLEVTSKRNRNTLYNGVFTAEVEIPTSIEQVRIFDNGDTGVSNKSILFNNKLGFINFCNDLKHYISVMCAKETKSFMCKNYDNYGEGLILKSSLNEISITIIALNYPVYDQNGNLTSNKEVKKLYEGTIDGRFYDVYSIKLHDVGDMLEDAIYNQEGEINYNYESFAITDGSNLFTNQY